MTDIELNILVNQMVIMNGIQILLRDTPEDMIENYLSHLSKAINATSKILPISTNKKEAL